MIKNLSKMPFSSVVRYCFHTNIKPGKLPEYIKYHDNIFPEVASGLAAHGVQDLNIYQVPDTNTLIMNINFQRDDGKNLGEALGPGSDYRKVDRCKDWEELMEAEFTGGWTEIKNIHSSSNWPNQKAKM